MLPTASTTSALTQALAKMTFAAVRYDGNNEVLRSILGERLTPAAFKQRLRRCFGRSMLNDEEVAALVAHFDDNEDKNGGALDGAKFLKSFFAIEELPRVSVVEEPPPAAAQPPDRRVRRRPRRPPAGILDPDELLEARLKHRACIEAHGVLDLSLPPNARDRIPLSSLANLSLDSLGVAPTLEGIDARYASRLVRAAAKLPFLRHLWLTNNTAVGHFPTALCRTLQHLSTLCVSGVGLRTLPDALATHATNIDKLYADRNSLDALPKTLAAMPKLRTLALSKNAFFDLPAHCLPATLHVLNFADNAISDLPVDALLRLRVLHLLDVRGNDLFHVAPDLFEKKRPRLKLLIVGDATSGRNYDSALIIDPDLDREMRLLLKARAAKARADRRRPLSP